MSSWEYRFPHVLITVSFVMAPRAGIVRAHFLARGVVPLHVLVTVSFVTAPRKEYRFFACPRKQCALFALCANGIVRWIFSQGLRPLHDCSFRGGLGFDLRVAGCYPAPLFYIVCFLGGGHCMWCGVGYSFVVGA